MLWIAGTGVGLAESPAGYRAPPVGTEFFVTETTRFRVIAATDESVTTENSSHAKATWFGGLVTREMSAKDRARLMGFFPLAPGARLAYDAGPGSERALTVVANDVVQVDGRTIPVMRVTRYQKDVEARGAVEGEYTLWFAPEYGFPLKLAYRHIAGDPPRTTDWQVVHIVPAGSVDGLWSLDLECHGSAFVRINRAVVRDGVLVNIASDHPSTYSTTESALRLSRTGDQLALSGTMMNASGDAMTISAHGTLVGESASGVGSIVGHGARTGCPFTANRL
ncbi:MAG TPA: hypothetical protein VMB81_33215 [Candidatus Sulfotelmatobacter sp.]|nr:hypothetical protein [Candidatus Sulfotelmatobacter sp.]